MVVISFVVSISCTVVVISCVVISCVVVIGFVVVGFSGVTISSGVASPSGVFRFSRVACPCVVVTSGKSVVCKSSETKIKIKVKLHNSAQYIFKEIVAAWLLHGKSVT